MDVHHIHFYSKCGANLTVEISLVVQTCPVSPAALPRQSTVARVRQSNLPTVAPAHVPVGGLRFEGQPERHVSRLPGLLPPLAQINVWVCATRRWPSSPRSGAPAGSPSSKALSGYLAFGAIGQGERDKGRQTDASWDHAWGDK